MTARRCSSPFERGARLAIVVMRGGEVTTEVIRKMFNVSPATAKRTMLDLERVLPVQSLKRSERASGWKRVLRLPK